MTQDPLFLVSVNLLIAVMVRCIKPNVLTALVLGIVMLVSSSYLGARHSHEIMSGLYQVESLARELTGRPAPWPPKLNRPFPDYAFVDQDGKLTRLSEFKGKVILIEPVGLACPACIAFSGGDARGPFRGVAAQPGMQSIDAFVRRFGRVRLEDDRLVLIQLLLFDKNFKAPTATDAREWAEHFGFERSKNKIVLAGNAELANPGSRGMIPGFQLIDRSFILRADSTGPEPPHDLYADLLPMIRKLMAEE